MYNKIDKEILKQKVDNQISRAEDIQQDAEDLGRELSHIRGQLNKL